MTQPPESEPHSPEPSAPREHTLSLKLRIWTACVASGAVAGLGSLWVLGTYGGPGADGSVLLGWLSGVATASVLTGFAAAVWLDHHLVGQLRGLLRGVHTGRVWELRGLPAASGWGELSDLGDSLQGILTTQRRNTRATEELERTRQQLAAVQEALQLWVREETWVAPTIEDGPVQAVAEAFSQGLARRDAVAHQNREVAEQVARELVASLADAHESAEQSERGFVEATALLTTVRELQRLSGELTTSLDRWSQASVVPAPEGSAARDAAREALEELIAASAGSVDSLGRGLLRVQEIHEQVQTIANRSTLIAIQVLTSERRDDPAGEMVALELKRLAQEVREATDRTAGFVLDVESAVTEAGERMQGVRARALAKLDALPEPMTLPAFSNRDQDDAQRLLERVREMVQDAARKGERLSAAGERASRAAERLTRRLDEEGAEADALVLRLTPIGRPVPPASAAPGLRLISEEQGIESAAEDELDSMPEELTRADVSPREEERP